MLVLFVFCCLLVVVQICHLCVTYDLGLPVCLCVLCVLLLFVSACFVLVLLCL